MKFSIILSALAVSSVLAATTPVEQVQDVVEAASVDAPSDAFESTLEDVSERAHHRKHHEKISKRKVLKGGSNKVTWYGGGQLNNPACGLGKVTDHTMAVAVSVHSELGKCGDWIHVHYNGKMVPARIMDHCAGCGSRHADATQGLFRKLAGSLDAGVLQGSNLHFRVGM